MTDTEISPNIPDTPALFIIMWGDVQHKSALELTAAVRDYWTTRETKLQEELRPIKTASNYRLYPLNGRRYKK